MSDTERRKNRMFGIVLSFAFGAFVWGLGFNTVVNATAESLGPYIIPSSIIAGAAVALSVWFQTGSVDTDTGHTEDGGQP